MSEKEKSTFVKSIPDYSYHISLVNVALENEYKLIEDLQENFYRNYRTKLNSHNYNIRSSDSYKPFIYYIVGNYDLAFFTEIDNFSFAQKVFRFDTKENIGNIAVPFNNQCITGILNEVPELSLSQAYQKWKFVSIFNLKLNNKFLVYNGSVFVDKIVKLIKNILGENEFLDFTIIHSFSWFELSILIFTDEVSRISRSIELIRELKLSDLDNYSDLLDNFICCKDPLLSYSDVFSETVTYFGINYSKVQDLSIGEINIDAITEWKIKPGHMAAFINALKESGLNSNPKGKMILGKSDFILEKSDQSPNWFDIHREIFKCHNGENLNELASDLGGIFEHVKNTKSRFELSFNISEREIQKKISDKSFRSKIRRKISVEEVNVLLKKLKISRQSREMSIKIFHSYLNGIEDEVLSIYFFDFYNYVLSFESWIRFYAEKTDAHFKNSKDNTIAHEEKSVVEIEQEIHQWINNFQQAYNLRMLNSYKHEDISETTLDFNSSIQQLLSLYNTIANFYGQLLHSKDTDFIVVLSNRSTISDYRAIHYNVSDLLHPEFIIFSLSKEVFNKFEYRSDNTFIKNFTELKIRFSNVQKEGVGEMYLTNFSRLVDSEIFDINYLVNDAMRYIVTCNMDSELFIYWTWACLLKDSSAYSLNSTIDEYIFAGVLFRLIFTLKLYDQKPDELLTCPIPELNHYWCRWYHVLMEEINLIMESWVSQENLDYQSNNFISPLKEIVQDKLGRMYRGFYSSEDGEESCKTIDSLKKFSLDHDRTTLMTLLNRKRFLEDNHRTDRSNLGLLNFEIACYHYLKKVQKMNYKEGRFNYNNRNWNSGLPIRNQVLSETLDGDGPWYFLDRTNGVFFRNEESARSYFKHRNSFLIKLWDYSMIFKGMLINKHGNQL